MLFIILTNFEKNASFNISTGEKNDFLFQKREETRTELLFT